MNNLIDSNWNHRDIVIEKSKWKNAVDIIYKNDTIINIETGIDFYLILRSYVFYKTYNVKCIYVISSAKFDLDEYENKKFSFNIYKYFSINMLNKFSVYDFYIWFDKVFITDYKYGESVYKAIGFRVVFYNDEDLLYPIYPWKSEWLEYNNI